MHFYTSVTQPAIIVDLCCPGLSQQKGEGGGGGGGREGGREAVTRGDDPTPAEPERGK